MHYISTHGKPSSINTLSPRINLQPRLGHIRVLQKIQRHPHEMSLDLVQLLADVLRRAHPVVDMPGFNALRWEELVVVFEGFDLAKVLI